MGKGTNQHETRTIGVVGVGRHRGFGFYWGHFNNFERHMRDNFLCRIYPRGGRRICG